MSQNQTISDGQSQTTVVEVVFPSMVNHYGTLFGGVALQWMDRAAWICSTKYARRTMVTIASDRVVFKKPILQGQMVELCAKIIDKGRTSVTVKVDMYAEKPLTGERTLATTGEFVMVALDDQGAPVEVSNS
ncbi:MAG: acyl-CoA thioesterase [Candidatus Zixiibacteriota bacterium]